MSQTAWGHQLRYQALRSDVGMDPVGRQYRVEAVSRLRAAMECIQDSLRILEECVARYLQDEVIKCKPNRRDKEYRERVEAQFCGRKGTPYWQNIEGENMSMKLVHACDHELTAALFINFQDYVGRDFSFWDWTALCSFAEGCKVFQYTFAQAEARGWLKVAPASSDFTVKAREAMLKKKLVGIIRMLRQVRNAMQHENILDLKFQESFDDVVYAARALGSNVKRVKEIREGASRYFPAQNTVEEIKVVIQQYEQ